MPLPTPDVSVRPAVPGDETMIATIQWEAWTHALGDKIPVEASQESFETLWQAAITSPPSREHRVFTATDGPEKVGFAAVVTGGEIMALEVARQRHRHGHGSRLLAACVDTMRTQGVSLARTWVLEGDSIREAFLTSAGFAPGGVERTLESAHGQVRESLWRAAL